MKELFLENSFEVALVDDEDYSRCQKFKWYVDITKTGNRVRRTQGALNLSNFVFNTFVKYDHQDRNYLNNQRKNLRECTNSQNGANKKKWVKNATSKFKGVSFFKSREKWRACIKVDYQFIHVGYFYSETEAAKAYDKAALKYFGEFAVLNFPKTEEL